MFFRNEFHAGKYSNILVHNVVFKIPTMTKKDHNYNKQGII